MRLIERNGSIEIWQSADGEYAVYGITQGGDPRWCLSLAMARELAG